MTATIEEFTHFLRSHRLLSPEQQVVLSSLRNRFADAPAAARELVRRGWLTPYQVNEYFLGRGGGLLLGSYVLLEKIGEGGMGLVFKARNWKLGQLVALKLIRKERLANAVNVRRFQREIRLAAQLDHSNIVRAFDADEVGGTHFFVMEFVEGVNLLEQVKLNGPLPVDEACSYIRQTALGLQHAFERGLVHRDIKPHNLLLTRAAVACSVPGAAAASSGGTSGEAFHQIKILDMGLVLEGAGEDDTSSVMTLEGVVMGTPDYIAPEQALNSHLVDIRADLYSLGCTFYYLLAGKVPFPGGSFGEKLLKHQMYEPEPLPKLRPGLSGAVTAVVRKLMAKHPDDRYQSPAQVAEALASVLANPAALAAAGASAAALEAPGRETSETPGQGTLAPETVTPLGPLDALVPAFQTVPATAQRRRRFQRGVLVGSAVAVVLLALVIILLMNSRQTIPQSGARSKDFLEPTPAWKLPDIAPRVPDNLQTGPVSETWCQFVATQRPTQQVKLVLAKLRELNPFFDGAGKHEVAGEVVTGLDFRTDQVQDITPLQALRGLKTLKATPTPGERGGVADLEPLRSLPLEKLDLTRNRVRDLTPLKAVPLKKLVVSDNAVRDLGPLRDMHLVSVEALRCHSLSDLTPLAGQALEFLSMAGSSVVDLAPLSTMALKKLTLDPYPWRDLQFLKNIPTLEEVNGQPVTDFLNFAAASRDAFAALRKRVASLPPPLQIAAIEADLKRLNHGFQGSLKPEIDNDQVTGLQVLSDTLVDLTPLRALPALRDLRLEGTARDKAQLQSLEPLRGLPLTSLTCTKVPVQSLAPLVNMPLRSLNVSFTSIEDIEPLAGMAGLVDVRFAGTGVTSLEPLRGTKLNVLTCDTTALADLSPLDTTELTHLYCAATRIMDLNPLRKAKLRTLQIQRTRVDDLTPLQKLPLTGLRCDFNPWRDTEVLRAIKTLKSVNNEPVDKFFAKVDAQRAALDAWAVEVRALPPQQQAEAVIARLRVENPGLGKQISTKISDNEVSELHLVTGKLVDVSPLRALAGLQVLTCSSLTGTTSPLADLWPLRGLKLERLNMNGTSVRDLRPLAGMPLRELRFLDTPVTDLSPLRGLPLVTLWCTYVPERDAAILRGLSTLKTINGQAAAKFLR